MEDYLETEYHIFFMHQKDSRAFNRGAMKNLGFLFTKQLYPDNYKEITFVFNDVDTMPYTKNFLPYETTKGIVKHFYGFHYTLGGIVSIKGEDFEKIGGFPNYWAWGYEDNLLQSRCLNAKLHIDRSIFFPIFDKNILHLPDGLLRHMNQGEFEKGINHIADSLWDIKNIIWTREKEMVHITHFDTLYLPPPPNTYQTRDLSKEKRIGFKSNMTKMRMV